MNDNTFRMFFPIPVSLKSSDEKISYFSIKENSKNELSNTQMLHFSLSHFENPKYDFADDDQ